MIHVACGVPNFTGRKGVAAFVTATLEQCSVRTRALLDNELAIARERLRATDRERIERLARRDEAIAAEMAAMLRARAASGGVFQPLLFEDIAIEKTTMTGANGERLLHIATRGRRAHSRPLHGATERVESALVMVLVVR